MFSINSLPSCRLSLLFALLGVISFLSTTTIASIVPSNEVSSYKLEKRDPSYVPANIALEGCSVKSQNFAKYVKNEGIQMGECYINARISPQVFAWFEPTDTIDVMREGGLYGTCYATSVYPKAEELIAWPNPNYACFLWTQKGVGGPIPKLPGTEMIPFPVVCPSNLDDCYSNGIYAQSGKMGKWGSQIPTFSGVWKPSKGSGGSYLWCDHIQSVCPVHNNLAMQMDQIAKLKCDVSSCPKYTGNLSVLTAASRASATNTGNGTKNGAGGDPSCGEGEGGASTGSMIPPPGNGEKAGAGSTTGGSGTTTFNPGATGSTGLGLGGGAAPPLEQDPSAGAPGGSAGTAGTAGSAGTAGTAGSAGTAGTAGSAGTAGTAGSAATGTTGKGTTESTTGKSSKKGKTGSTGSGGKIPPPGQDMTMGTITSSSGADPILDTSAYGAKAAGSKSAGKTTGLGTTAGTSGQGSLGARDEAKTIPRRHQAKHQHKRRHHD